MASKPEEFDLPEAFELDRFVLSIAGHLVDNLMGATLEQHQTNCANVGDSEEQTCWCRNNDWWLPRGTQNIHIFDFSEQKFVTVVPKSGVDYPILQFLDPDDVNVPKIVR